MAKEARLYACQSCGWKTQRWVGRCGGCGEWNTVIEETWKPAQKRPSLGGEPPVTLAEVDTHGEERIATGLEELDRVLGGGMVPGSAILIGGPPGIGKSTLMLQLCNQLALLGHRPLYITGEESLQQIRLRAKRLGIEGKNLLLGAETNLETVKEHLENLKPTILVVDSIQMIYKEGLESAPGTVSQVKECANELIYTIKGMDCVLFLLGHVTKQGLLAGPKVLEHMVDTVLYFEGERTAHFRILRAVKNRFGPTNELAIFEMREAGLCGVDDPSRLFLSRGRSNTAGTATVACMEGTRVLFLEIQSLVTKSNYNVPERRVSGVDYNRVSMLIAVLDRRLGLRLRNQDVFVNVVGGVRVEEPAADLAIALAMASSLTDRPVPAGTVLLGEVGLAGEVRGVSQIETRLKEAKRLGFSRVIAPQDSITNMVNPKELEILRVAHLKEAMKYLEGPKTVAYGE
ncbi:MAG TPA: DNA repair protein RadA [Candidatus Hypogeohydataceae bacterium YC41]